MKAGDQKTILMRVEFSDKNLAKPALENMGRDRMLTVNILRGRITQEDAFFDLEVSGPARRIGNFIRLSDSWGAAVGTSSMRIA